MDRFKNYGLWISIFALIPLLLEGFGVDVLPENYDEIIKSLLGVLVLAGVINNPEKGKGYVDPKKENKEE